MIGLGAVIKLAKGSLTRDELLELLAQVGVQAEPHVITEGERQATFEDVARASLIAESQMVRIDAKMKDGSRATALIVFHERRGRTRISPNILS